MHGMKEVEEFLRRDIEMDSFGNVEDIVTYIQNIENFKHCEDEIRAAGLLETHQLSLHHVPGHMLKSKEVKYIIYMY